MVCARAVSSVLLLLLGYQLEIVYIFKQFGNGTSGASERLSANSCAPGDINCLRAYPIRLRLRLRLRPPPALLIRQLVPPPD